MKNFFIDTVWMNISHSWVNWVISINGRCDKSLNLHWVSYCEYKIYIITHLISKNSNLYITRTVIEHFYEEIIFYFYNLGIIKEWFKEIFDVCRTGGDFIRDIAVIGISKREKNEKLKRYCDNWQKKIKEITDDMK